MHRKYSLYQSFRADMERLIAETGSANARALLDAIRAGADSMDPACRRLVDRLDREQGECGLWRNIRTSYRLRGNSSY